MNDQVPIQVDTYLEETLVASDMGLNDILERAAQAGLPEHHVSRLQGQFLTILTKAVKANRILEIGTLAGYSTICFAKGLGCDGEIVTLEADAKAASVANETFQRHANGVNIRLMEGDAKLSLAKLLNEGGAPFDLIFIDADKPSNPIYLVAALQLSKAGTIIIGDNVIRDGAIVDANSSDPKIQGVRTFLDAMGQNRSLLVTALQTVGSKGYDGFSMALVV